MAVNRALAIATGALLVLLVLSWAVYALLGRELVEKVYSGQITWLGSRVMRDREVYPLAAYYREAHDLMLLWTFRAASVIACLVTAVTWIQHRMAAIANDRLESETASATAKLVTGIFLICLVWAIVMAGVGWKHTLTDLHGFRQTQTAITSYYLMRGGDFLNYETPVMGAPWSIPFEFPLYQWLVASTANALATPLDQTGRFISEVFFALTLVVVWWWLAELKIQPVYRLVFVSLTLISPEYIFWSRAFMIESTALFFSMSYLLFACRYARNRARLNLLLGGLCGVVASLVKVTTMPGFVTVAGLFYLCSLPSRSVPRLAAIVREIGVPFVVFVCLPVFAALVWTHHADALKALNVVGVHATAAASMEWNFGSIAQRFSPHTWTVFFTRTIPDVIGGNLALVLSVAALFAARHRVLPFVFCVAGFLSDFLVFTNLHMHHYYSYANGIFLVAASSCSVVGLLEQKRWKPLVGRMLLLLMVLLSMKHYSDGYYWFQKRNAWPLANVSEAVKQATAPDEVVLIFGEEWSSELPYYAERRALMWPEAWMPQDMDSPEMKEALRKLEPARVGTLVVCNAAKQDVQLIERAAAVLNVGVEPRYQDDRCGVFARAPGVQTQAREPSYTGKEP